jgi:hypothetical protein
MYSRSLHSRFDDIQRVPSKQELVTGQQDGQEWGREGADQHHQDLED